MKVLNASGDVCLKCGESRGAIRRERLICWDGYDELGRPRFKPWHSRRRIEGLELAAAAFTLDERVTA